MPEAAPAEVEPTRGDDGGSFVSKKLGPLPVWGWVIVGAAIVGVLVIRARGSRAPAAVGSLAGSQGVSSIDPLTGQQLITAFEDLNSTLASQAQGAKAGANVDALPWHFGPATSPNWVWRLTPSGQAAWQQSTGSPANFALQPSTTIPPSWLPQYSWQIAELPAGTTWQEFVAALNAAVGGKGGAAVGSGTQGGGSSLSRSTRG